MPHATRLPDPLCRLDCHRAGSRRAALAVPCEPARGVWLEVMSVLYSFDPWRDLP